MEFPGQMTLMPENPNTEPSCRSTSDHDREEEKEIENKQKKGGPKTKDNTWY